MTSTLRPTPTLRGDSRAPVFLLIASALTIGSLSLSAQERPLDKDVKILIEQIDDARDKFEGNLDGDLKSSTLRSPVGEVKVQAALQDYQDNVKKLKDRFTASYSASAELTAVLKQATNIDTFMKATPSITKGRSEWDREALALKQLAEVYGATFPLPDNAVVRRMNDGETATTAAAVESAADRFKSDLDKTSAIPNADRDMGKKAVELLAKNADTVKSRTNDGKPATAEFRQLQAQVATVQTFIGVHPVPTGAANWKTLQDSMAKLEQAFVLTK